MVDDILKKFQEMLNDGTAYSYKITQVLAIIDLDFVDNRMKKGGLWVLGDESIKPVMDLFAKHGVQFKYKAEGGKATMRKPAWYTSTTLTRLMASVVKIIDKYGALSEKRQPICFNYVQWYDNNPCYDLRHWKDDSCQDYFNGITLDKNEVEILKTKLTTDVITSRDELLGIIDIGKGNIDDYGLVAKLNSTKTMNKEARVLDWTYGKVLDIRQWNEDHTKCRKGITLDQGELEAFVALLQRI